MPQSSRWCKRARFDLKPFITGRIALEDLVEQGFDTLINDKDTAVKVLAHPLGLRRVLPCSADHADIQRTPSDQLGEPPCSDLFLSCLFYEFRCLPVKLHSFRGCCRLINPLTFSDCLFCHRLHFWVRGESAQLASGSFCLAPPVFNIAAALSAFPDIVFSVRSVVGQARLAPHENVVLEPQAGQNFARHVEGESAIAEAG